MSRVFKYKDILLCSIFPSLTINEVDFNKFKEAKGLFIEDPWERVKSIFSTDVMGDFHPELKYALDMFYMGLIGGAFYGGTIESMKQTEKFIRTNDSNIYINKSDMYKILANENLKALMRGALRSAPKFGLFCGCFTLICSCCEAYRNKSHIIDCTVAGFSVGAVSRFAFGLKGMFSGGLIGGLLGSSYGVLKWARYKLTNTGDLEIKYAHFALVKQRERLKKGITESRPEEEEDVHGLNALDDLEVEETKTAVEKQK